MATLWEDAAAGSLLGRELSAAVVLFHEAIAGRLGLTAADHKALDIVDRHGPLTASELADQTGLTRAAVTALVDRLERAGYVRRGNDPGDRRRVMVSVSGHHDPLVVEAFASLGHVLGETVGGYTEAERAAVLHFVTSAIDALQAETRRLTAAAP